MSYHFTSAVQSSPVCERPCAFSPSSSTLLDLEQNLFMQVLPFDYILFYFFFLPPIRVFILGHSFIHCVRDDFLRRNFNTHIAEILSLDGDLLIRWHGIGGRTVSKTRESSYKMMLSRPTQTTFSRLFPLFPLSSVIKKFLLFNFCYYFCTKIPIFIFFF